MRSPASAIVWEIWLKNRWGFWVLLGSFLCGLAVRLSGPSEDEVLKFIAGAAMVVSFLVTFAIFSYAESGVQISFPTRTFALPVRTQMLVNCPILAGNDVLCDDSFRDLSGNGFPATARHVGRCVAAAAGARRAGAVGNGVATTPLDRSRSDTCHRSL